MKKLIRLTESDLHRIVKESVNRILMESEDFDASVYVGYKTFNTNKFQEVQNFLNEKGYRFDSEKTYVHGPNAGTPEYQHNRLSGGIIQIEGKLPKDEAYSLAEELLITLVNVLVLTDICAKILEKLNYKLTDFRGN